jgi:hypothetical protein
MALRSPSRSPPDFQVLETRVVVYAGMAELITGAISMGLGGFLGAKSKQYILLFTTYHITLITII